MQSQRKPRWPVVLPVMLALVSAVLYLFWPRLELIQKIVGMKLSEKKTVSERLAEFGPQVEARLAPKFQACGVSFPPERLALLVFKNERMLEVYGSSSGQSFKKVVTFPILAASGQIGPKLREGDRQVPEGIYRIEYLNPNSLYHLSLKINYPNDFDRLHADRENRTNMGSDIMIHGNQVSIGCVAVGDQAAEDIFVLAARTGLENVKVIISPVDFRCSALPEASPTLPDWTSQLYEEIRKELRGFPVESAQE